MFAFPPLLYLSVLLAAWSGTFNCAARQTQEAMLGVYEGSTPCGDMPREFLGIPLKDSCEFIKWQFTFYKASGMDSSSRFIMKAEYGLTQPNTLGFSRSSVQEKAGIWSTQYGIPGNAKAIVYRLVTNSNETISFIELNKEMLHPIDPSGRLMIGNAGWSYTLSRTDSGGRK